MKVKKNKRDAVEYSDDLDLTPSAENLKSCEVFYKLNLDPQIVEELDPVPLAVPVGFEAPKTKRELLASFGYKSNPLLYDDDEGEEDASSYDYVRDEFYDWVSEYELDENGRSEIDKIIARDEENRLEMEKAMEFYKKMKNTPPPPADERVEKVDGSTEEDLAQSPIKVDSNEV